MSNYQFDYTNQSAVAKNNMYNRSGRNVKADKIISVLRDYYSGQKLSDLSLLDVSCSTGMMAKHFSLELGVVSAIDIDEKAVEYAKINNRAENVNYFVMDALNTTFEADSFDVVVCNQMYEHVPDSSQLINEIHRVLKPGGVCYFGATNRLKVIETHYGNLPFLSYLPKPLANIYLKLTGKGDIYYETLLSYWGLKGLVRQFYVIDYTEKIINRPEQYKALDVFEVGSFKHKVAKVFVKYLYVLMPGYVWMLVKDKHGGT
jgi:SAM-dependent methyltransferase